MDTNVRNSAKERGKEERERGGRKNLSPGMGGGGGQCSMSPEEKDERERGLEGEGDAICQRGFVKDGAFEVITRHSLTRLPSTAHPPLSLPKPPYFFPSSLLSLLVWETERRV